MSARARVAGQAFIDALSDIDPGASERQIADKAASAAESAYDDYADRELVLRLRTLDGTNAGTKSSAVDGPLSSSSSTEFEGKIPVSEAVLEQRPYFTAVALSYIVGLGMAFAANSITHLGQPALLYIVPCTLSAVLMTAISRDELYRIWEYTDVATFGTLASLSKAEAKSKDNN